MIASGNKTPVTPIEIRKEKHVIFSQYYVGETDAIF